MTTKHWFYSMLSLPILIPVALGLFAHILYIALPNPDFTWEISDGMLHHTYSNGNSAVGIGGWFDYSLKLLLAATPVYPLVISLFCTILHTYAIPYLVFLGGLLVWSRNRPFSDIRKIIWRLPLFAYPVLLIFLFLGSGNPTLYYKFLSTLLLQVVALPIYLMVAYTYLFIAWHLVPKKYRKEQ